MMCCNSFKSHEIMAEGKADPISLHFSVRCSLCGCSPLDSMGGNSFADCEMNNNTSQSMKTLEEGRLRGGRRRRKRTKYCKPEKKVENIVVKEERWENLRRE